jgi:hypothetical protein
LHVEPHTALHAIGYTDTPTRRSADLRGYGLHLSDDAVARIGHTTRIPEQVLRSTLLDVYDQGPFAIHTSEHKGAPAMGLQDWVYTGTTTACIECLTANDYQWLLGWRLPWTAVCTTHHRVQVSACPACHQPFTCGRGSDGSTGLPSSRRSTADRCLSPVTAGSTPWARDGVCAHRYADIPSATCDQPDILAAQHLLERLLTGSHRNQHRDWWVDMRAVTGCLLTHGAATPIIETLPGLPADIVDAVHAHFDSRDRTDSDRARFVAAGGDHRRARRARPLSRTPNNPALLAPLITLAVAVLHDLDRVPPLDPPVASAPLRPGQGIALFTDLMTARDKNSLEQVQTRGASAHLRAAMSRLTGYNTLVARTVHHDYPHLDTVHIPRLWPLSAYQQVSHLFTGTGTTEEYARGYLSLCAAKVLTRDTWHTAADALDWNPRDAIRCANAVTCRLTATGDLESVHQHVHHTLAAMTARADRINYRDLSNKYAHSTAVDPSQWREICLRADLRLRGTGARRRNLAAWLWHNIALQPLGEWPGWTETTHLHYARATYRQFLTTDLPHLLPALNQADGGPGEPTRAALEPRHIPRLWPAKHYRQVEDVLRGTGTRDDYARQYLSLAAVRHLSGGTWRQAAEALHGDADQGETCSRTVAGRLRHSGHSETIDQHIHDTLTVLESTPPAERTDYRALAEQYATHTEISTSEWHALCQQAGITLPNTRPRRRNVAAWKWHTIACEPLSDWPGWAATSDPISARKLYRRFITEHPELLTSIHAVPETELHPPFRTERGHYRTRSAAH